MGWGEQGRGLPQESLGTVLLLYGCVPTLQDFQETQPVPYALVNNSTREHLGTLGYPEAARTLPALQPQRTPPPPAFACESPSRAEGKPSRSREENGAANL
ncbi:hypothetical protein HPG69_008385, partial [Diceros bicornis minor]